MTYDINEVHLLIEAYQASGLTMRKFCAQHGIAVSSFYKKKQWLNQQPAKAQGFLPLEIIPNEPQQTSSVIEPVNKSQSIDCSIEYPNGIVVKLNFSEFDPAISQILTNLNTPF